MYAKSHGVTIKHYHAENGRFKGKAFLQSIEENGQSISFSGVGAHHQNEIAEKRIGDQQRRATTLLLHAERRWPDVMYCTKVIMCKRTVKKWAVCNTDPRSMTCHQTVLE
jgi:transposase InsO family protein